MPLPAVDFAAVIIKFRDSFMNKFNLNWRDDGSFGGL